MRLYLVALLVPTAANAERRVNLLHNDSTHCFVVDADRFEAGLDLASGWRTGLHLGYHPADAVSVLARGWQDASAELEARLDLGRGTMRLQLSDAVIRVDIVTLAGLGGALPERTDGGRDLWGFAGGAVRVETDSFAFEVGTRERWRIGSAPDTVVARASSIGPVSSRVMGLEAFAAVAWLFPRAHHG
jgi:hypothetical protein